MPKLLLSVSDLRSLAGYAVRAIRHPVATGQEAATVVRTIAGGFVSQPATDAEPVATEPPGPVAAEPARTPDPAMTAEAAVRREPEAEPAPEDIKPRRTGPAPHVSRMPRDIERDVAAELEDDEAEGSAGATFAPEDPGHEPEQPGEQALGDPGVAKAVRKEKTRAAKAAATKKR